MCCIHFEASVQEGLGLDLRGAKTQLPSASLQLGQVALASVGDYFLFTKYGC